ncbi:MAG: alpha/beta hydrolase [Hyphomicrobiales bacterium]
MKNQHPLFERLKFVRWLGFSNTCLFFTLIFFALSLAPSLLPRTPLIQGFLSGFTAAVGFGIGKFVFWLWVFLEIPIFMGRPLRALWTLGLLIAGMLVLYFAWLAGSWQDSVRALMNMDKLEGYYIPVVIIVAVPTMLVLVLLGQAFATVISRCSNWISKLIPRRISLFLSFLIVSTLLVAATSGTIGRWAVERLDSAFLHWDGLIEDGTPKPILADFTGGPNSLVEWRGLGRQGRRFISRVTTKDDIAAFTSIPAKQPLRIYVGLGAAETPDARAKLALKEMIRIGAFERSVLVLATPTGTGMVDPAAIDALEFLHHGDTAVVAQQYSYLTSYVSLFLEPGYAATSATALFREVHGYWSRLPRQTRPELYLHGLSLGSYGSEQSIDFYYMLDNLIGGAVWSGPTYRNPRWASFTESRNSDSPEWLPIVRDSSLVRFTNQKSALNLAGTSWGPLRLVYLQYASDPVTFFSPFAFLHQPAWMSDPRGPDVSKKLTWYPIITGLQIAFDMTQSAATERGFGHMYSASGYIDAWIAVTEPQGWSPEDVDRLKKYLIHEKGL